MTESKKQLQALDLTLRIWPHPATDDWTDFLSSLSDFLLEKIATSEISGYEIKTTAYLQEIADVKRG